MKKCSNCGKMNLNDAMVCKACQCEFRGTVDKDWFVDNKEEQATFKSEEVNRKAKFVKKINIKVVSILLIVSFLIGIWIIMLLGGGIASPILTVVFEVLLVLSVIVFVVSSVFSAKCYFAEAREAGGEEYVKEKKKVFWGVFGLIFAFGFAVIVLSSVNREKQFIYDLVLFLAASAVLGFLLYKKNPVPQSRIIDHCPRCNSKDIVIYRKGYDWNKGFWYRMFNIKGGSYLAGMESNRAECCCNKCGKKWVTDYDYRTLRKK